MKDAIILLSQAGTSRILGLSLLQRLILYARRGGLERFWLQAEDASFASLIRENLLSDRRFGPGKMEIELLTPEAIDWLSGHDNSGPYILVLEDTVAAHPDFFTVLTASRYRPDKDLILVQPGGEGLTAEADDCGVFLLKREKLPEVLPLILKLRATSPGYLQESGYTVSSERTVVKCPFLVKVNSQQAAREAEKLLLETGRKPVDSYITRVFFRPISLKLTRNLINLGLTPNHISLIVLAMELVSVYLILQGTYLKMALGGLLFQLSSIVDCCDGENARLTCRVSRFGTIFDVSADAFLFVTFFTALPLGLHRQFGDPLWLYIGAFGLLSMVAFYLQIIYYARRAGIGFHIHSIALEIEASILDPDFQNWADRIASRIAFIYRRDFFTTLAFFLIVLGAAEILAITVSFFAFLEAVYFGSWSRRQLKKKSSSELQPA